MDKRLVTYDHRIYEEEIDTWYHRLEYEQVSGTDAQVLVKVHDFMKENQDLSKSFFHLISITKFPDFKI